MASSHEWLLEFSALSGISYVTALNVSRALRAAGLYAKPARGRGHRYTQVTPFELSSFILAMASAQASDAVEDVRNFRALPGPRDPYLGKGDLGDVFDRMIEGLGVNPEGGAEVRYVPHEVHLVTNPHQAALVWLNPDGSRRLANAYGSITTGSVIVRQTFISNRVIELAGRMATIGRATPLSVEYLTRLPKAVPTGRIIVHNQVRPTTRQLGLRGFRAWLQTGEAADRELCDCGWAPELGPHYRVIVKDIAHVRTPHHPAPPLAGCGVCATPLPQT